MISDKKSYVALQSMGDNLISLSLLSKLDCRVNVLGTSSTLKILKAFNLSKKINVEVIFDEIPSFYNVKKKNLLEVINSIIQFRKIIKEKKIKELIFEKNDLRTRLLVFALGIKCHYPQKNKNIYFLRKDIIEKIYKNKITYNSKFESKKNNNNIILISPLTSLIKKNIRNEDLKILISLLQRKKENKIILLDYSKEYIVFKDLVDKYVTDTTLNDVKTLMLNCDFFIGPDSFLIHVAYFLNRRYLIIFNKYLDSFIPPSIDNKKKHIITQENIDNTSLFMRVLKENKLY